jgi:hypothetical protein
MNTETNELADYVRQLAARTLDGSIGWSPVSPSAFAAQRETPSGKKRMTLTRARRPDRPDRKRQGTLETIAENVEARLAFPPRLPEPQADLLFQVEALDERNKRIELTIDTREKPELNEVFEKLFAAAKSSVDAQSARILRDLVG